MDESNTQQPKKTYRQADVEAMYRRNPNPKRRYDITMTIKNAPGTFEDVSWGAQYDAPDCVYMMDGTAGVHGNVDTAIAIDFKKIDAATYIGTIYLDAMLDEDYFGKGECKWQFTGAYARLRATGKGEETLFVSFIDPKDVAATKTITSYYLFRDYPAVPNFERYKTNGSRDVSKYRPELQAETFSITMLAKEVQ